jgi:hypothetical protein
MKAWVSMAIEWTVVRRALKTSLIVGTLLVLINQGDLVWAGNWAAVSIPKLLLTYCVPYAVSTNASVGGRLDAERVAAR